LAAPRANVSDNLSGATMIAKVAALYQDMAGGRFSERGQSRFG